MFLFNNLKHHLPSIVQFISEKSDHALSELNILGNSQMDLYVGTLSIENIYQELSNLLLKINKLDKSNYKDWIKQFGYRKIQISDNSEWILLQGNHPDQYIHIHPARYSPHTLRAKASSLKTAIAIHLHKEKDSIINTVNVNKFRKDLGLSPIKNIDDSAAIKVLFELIGSST